MFSVASSVLTLGDRPVVVLFDRYGSVRTWSCRTLRLDLGPFRVLQTVVKLH